ncbi:hypothetical protein BGZ65_010851, partial [Modicella reniformis]
MDMMTTDERQEHRGATDPYRAAYSQHPQHQQQQQQQDFNQMSHSSRHSINSSSDVSVSGGQRYPMQALSSQHGSNPHLPSPFYQQQHSQIGGATPTSSVYGGQSERYQDHNTEGSIIGLTTRPSPMLKGQFKYEGGNNGSTTPVIASSRPMTAVETAAAAAAAAAEEEENAEILRKVTRSNGPHPSIVSHHSKRGGGRHHQHSYMDDDEEGQERGSMRRRESKRSFSFESVTPMGGDPYMSSTRIQEAFSMQLLVDNRDNYVPLQLSSIDMMIWLKIDQSLIATNEGFPSSFNIKPRTIQQITLPMMLDYTSVKIDPNTDGTLQELLSACRKPTDATAKIQGINLTVGGKLKVKGLSWIWNPEFAFNIDG